MTKPSPPGRRFTLLDAIVLVAATAVGAALSREPWSGIAEHWPSVMDDWVEVLFEAPALVMPSLLVWSLAVFLLGLRPPRPRFRRLARQPGLVACGLASLLLTVHGLLYLSLLPMMGWPPFFIDSDVPFTLLSVEVGAAVLCAWLVLFLTRRRRPEPNWIDRAGRALGLGWILLFLVFSGLLTRFDGGWSSNCAVRSTSVNAPPSTSSSAKP